MYAAVGIDLGSQNCVISAFNKTGLEVLTNDLSNRATPTVISFTNKQRLIGESGLTKLCTNYNNTIQYSSRFFGLQENSLYLEEENK